MQAISAFLLIIFIGLLIWLIWFAFTRKNVVKRGLKDAEEKLIRDFKDGDFGKIMGQVFFAGKTVTAPLSKRPCAWYHVLVEEHRGKKGGGLDGWATLIEEEKYGDVVIFDGTNYAMIDTTKVKSYLEPDVHYTTCTFVDASPDLEKFLEQRGWSSTSFLGFNKNLRYHEGVLEENEVIAVAGKGHWVDNAELQLNIPAEKVLVISANHRPVYVSDDEGML